MQTTEDVRKYAAELVLAEEEMAGYGSKVKRIRGD
jgi:hypothetical protein